MARSATRQHIDRLDWLAARLQDDEQLVVREVAEELAVSARSVSRDIQLLRDRGFPIESTRGRGGGFRLATHWGSGRVSLDTQEAISLLFSIAMTPRSQAPVLMANLAPLQRKLVASFPDEDQQRIRLLKHRILVGADASASVRSGYLPASKKITDKMQEVFFRALPARLGCRPSTGGFRSLLVEAHYLVLNDPAWYALCWDRLGNKTVIVRFDEINMIKPIAPSFEVRPIEDFERVLAESDVAIQ